MIKGSVYRKFFDEFEKSVADGTSNECFATKFNSVVEKYNFVPSSEDVVGFNKCLGSRSGNVCGRITC